MQNKQTFRVWYANSRLAMVFPELQADKIGETHTMVGLIQACNQEHAFIKAQTPQDCEFPRSMSVGDVLESKGEYLLVESLGWETIAK